MPLTLSRFLPGHPLRGWLLPALLASTWILQPTHAAAQITATLNITDADGTNITANVGNWVTSEGDTFALVQPGADLNQNWAWMHESFSDPLTGDSESRNVLRWVHPNSNNTTQLSVYDVSGKIDPYLLYSFSVTNTSAVTQTYTFTFGAPIAPTITGGYTVLADVGVSLSTTSPTATIAPVSPATKFQHLELSDDGGATTFNAGVNVGGTYSRTTNGTSIFTDGFGPINSSTALIIDYWEFRTTFTLTPGDAVGISGFAELTPIPEPSFYALLASAGALAVGMLRRARGRMVGKAA